MLTFGLCIHKKLAQLERPQQSTISTAVLVLELCMHKISIGVLLCFMCTAFAASTVFGMSIVLIFGLCTHKTSTA